MIKCKKHKLCGTLLTILSIIIPSQTMSQTNQKEPIQFTGLYISTNYLYTRGNITPDIELASTENSLTSNILEEIPMIGAFPVLTKENHKIKGSSVAFTVGYLYEYPTKVITGLEAELQYSPTRTTHNYLYESPSEPYTQLLKFNNGKSHLKMALHLKGKVGYKFTERLFSYLSIGLSAARLDYQMAKSAQSCTRGEEDLNFSCENLGDYDWGQSKILTNKKYIELGINYGFGLNYAITNNWLINAEYTRANLKSVSKYSMDLDTNSYKIGIIYKF